MGGKFRSFILLIVFLVSFFMIEILAYFLLLLTSFLRSSDASVNTGRYESTQHNFQKHNMIMRLLLYRTAIFNSFSIFFLTSCIFFVMIQILTCFLLLCTLLFYKLSLFAPFLHFYFLQFSFHFFIYFIFSFFI